VEVKPCELRYRVRHVAGDAPARGGRAVHLGELREFGDTRAGRKLDPGIQGDRHGGGIMPCARVGAA